MKTRLILAAVALLVCAATADASIIFTLGNNPQPGEENILLNTGTTGNTVLGTTNTSGVTVVFSSTDTIEAPSSGQARITRSPEGTALTNLTIAVQGGTYTDLIINPFIGPCTACTPGDATVTVHQSVGPDAVFSYALGNGQNFLTIVAKDGETITSTDLSMPGGINDLRQPRISGAGSGGTGGVPEPTTLTIAGAGLIVIGLLKKRRRLT